MIFQISNSNLMQNIFRTAQSEYNHYEDLFFGKVKGIFLTL